MPSELGQPGPASLQLPVPTRVPSVSCRTQSALGAVGKGLLNQMNAFKKHGGKIGINWRSTM